MRKLWMALALLGGLTALPAHAADVATLACLDDQLGTRGADLVAGQVNSILGAVAQGRASDRTEAGAAEAQAALEAAILACARKHGWSETQAMAAAVYATPHFGWQTAVAFARTKGLDPLAIKKQFDALSAEDQLAIVSKDYQMVESGIVKLATTLMAEKLVGDENAEVAGGLIGILALRVRALANFTEA